MSRSALAPLVLVLALTIGGCTTTRSTSSRDFQGAEGAVADAISDFASAGRRKDEGKICTKLLTRELAQRLRAGPSTCETEVSDAVSDADDYELTVKDVSVSGQTATAQVENDDRTVTLRLQRVGAAWRIASLGD